MTITNWAALAVAITTLIGSVFGAIKWLVKHYLSELKNNGGSSMRDSLDRLEKRVDDLYKFLLEK